MRDAQQKDHARWRRAKYRKPEVSDSDKRRKKMLSKTQQMQIEDNLESSFRRNAGTRVHGIIAVMHVMHAAFVVSAVCQPIHLFHTPVPMSPSFSFWFLTSTVAVEPKTVAVQRNVRERIFPPFAFGVEPQMLQPGSGATVGGGGSQTA